MPFAFLIVGLMLLVIGVRNQTSTAITLLQKEFTGSGSFIQWFIAIFIIGAIGYWKPAKGFSDAFMGLIILVMIIANENSNGLFAAFEQAMQNTTASPATPSSTAAATASTATGATATPTGSASNIWSSIIGSSSSPSGQSQTSWLNSLFAPSNSQIGTTGNGLATLANAGGSYADQGLELGASGSGLASIGVNTEGTGDSLLIGTLGNGLAAL